VTQLEERELPVPRQLVDQFTAGLDRAYEAGRDEAWAAGLQWVVVVRAAGAFLLSAIFALL
jgi:hypothetical protein